MGGGGTVREKEIGRGDKVEDGNRGEVGEDLSDGVGDGVGVGKINTEEDSSARVDRQRDISRLINKAKCICSLPNLSEEEEEEQREPSIRELLVVRYTGIAIA